MAWFHSGEPGVAINIAHVILPLDDLVEEAIVPLAEHRSERIKTLIDPGATSPRPTLT